MRAREGEAAHLLLQRLFRERLGVPRELQEEVALRERAQEQLERGALLDEQKRIAAAVARRAHDLARRDGAERERHGES